MIETKVHIFNPFVSPIPKNVSIKILNIGTLGQLGAYIYFLGFRV